MRPLLVVQCGLLLLHSSFVRCHLPSYVSTPSNKIEQFCQLADTCMHDTIPICGTMGTEKRTFLDLCDLLEFACDTNQNKIEIVVLEKNGNMDLHKQMFTVAPPVYTHVDDTDDCPDIKKKG